MSFDLVLSHIAHALANGSNSSGTTADEVTPDQKKPIPRPRPLPPGMPDWKLTAAIALLSGLSNNQYRPDDNPLQIFLDAHHQAANEKYQRLLAEWYRDHPDQDPNGQNKQHGQPDQPVPQMPRPNTNPSGTSPSDSIPPVAKQPTSQGDYAPPTYFPPVSPDPSAVGMTSQGNSYTLQPWPSYNVDNTPTRW